MAPAFFKLLLIAVVLYSLWKGGRDERAVAILCIAGAVVSPLVAAPVAERFTGVELPLLLVDATLLGGFVAIALRSPRFWPLWVAGLQLTTMLGHLLRGFDSDLVPKAYGAALMFWSYPILLILAAGTWRHYRRVQAEQRLLAG